MNWRRQLHEQLASLVGDNVPAIDGLDSARLPEAAARSRRTAVVPLSRAVGTLDGDLASDLENTTRKAIVRADEILDLELDLKSDKFGDVVRGINSAAKTIIQTQVRVDEHRLRARKLDVLPKLLEAIAQEEARRLV